MLKWRDYEEDGTLFEVFLPEHDRESSSALLRAVCRGHIVAERWVHLTWRPTFGPDEGDVAALDAELDGLIVELASKPAPETGGSYVPGPVQIEPPERLFALLQTKTMRAKSIGILTVHSSALPHAFIKWQLIPQQENIHSPW